LNGQNLSHFFQKNLIQRKRNIESKVFIPETKTPDFRNVIKLTENEKEAGVCLYVSEQTPANTYSKTA
jgi:hypothetical protein